jgi:hypothetical protein
MRRSLAAACGEARPVASARLGSGRNRTAAPRRQIRLEPPSQAKAAIQPHDSVQNSFPTSLWKLWKLQLWNRGRTLGFSSDAVRATLRRSGAVWGHPNRGRAEKISERARTSAAPSDVCHRLAVRFGAPSRPGHGGGDDAAPTKVAFRTPKNGQPNECKARCARWRNPSSSGPQEHGEPSVWLPTPRCEMKEAAPPPSGYAAPRSLQGKCRRASTRPVALPFFDPPPRIEGASDTSRSDVPARPLSKTLPPKCRTSTPPLPRCGKHRCGAN